MSRYRPQRRLREEERMAEIDRYCDLLAEPTPAVAMLSRNAERARQMNEESRHD